MFNARKVLMPVLGYQAPPLSVIQNDLTRSLQRKEDGLSPCGEVYNL